MIAALLEGPPQVIATGGGAFIDPATRTLILERSTSIWLDGAVETLARRAAKRGHRPLLNGDPAAQLGALAEARNPIYAEAHVRVRSDVGQHGRVVDAIIAALAAR
jgi:shikimate kinase